MRQNQKINMMEVEIEGDWRFRVTPILLLSQDKLWRKFRVIPIMLNDGDGGGN